MREFWPVLPAVIALLVILAIIVRIAERESARTIRDEPTEHGPFS